MPHQVTFKHALAGLKYAFSTQPNFRIHSLIALAAVILGLVLNLSSTEWLILLFSVFLVFICEMINTALESITDLVYQKHHLKAKIAKDVSAGMVLLAAFASIGVGIFIFIPKILNLLAIIY